jgi:hypothetical protein
MAVYIPAPLLDTFKPEAAIHLAPRAEFVECKFWFGTKKTEHYKFRIGAGFNNVY